jgi:ribonuclease P protein component
VGIPHVHRLRRSADWERVRTSGRSWTNRWLVLGVLSNDSGQARVGVTASRRVGGAVQRVRAKRLIREAVRPHLDEIVGGWDLIFIARAPLGSASFHQITQAVTQLLQRAGLLVETEP